MQQQVSAALSLKHYVSSVSLWLLLCCLFNKKLKACLTLSQFLIFIFTFLVIGSIQFVLLLAQKVIYNFTMSM